MAVKIEFKTNGDAFKDNGHFIDGYDEIAMILRTIADRVEHSRGGWISDSNGNQIGSWEATIDAEDEDARDFREASE